jgi:hypothetical protein
MKCRYDLTWSWNSCTSNGVKKWEEKEKMRESETFLVFFVTSALKKKSTILKIISWTEFVRSASLCIWFIPNNNNNNNILWSSMLLLTVLFNYQTFCGTWFVSSSICRPEMDGVSIHVTALQSIWVAYQICIIIIFCSSVATTKYFSIFFITQQSGICTFCPLNVYLIPRLWSARIIENSFLQKLTFWFVYSLTCPPFCL